MSVTFTTNALISEADSSFDGQDIVVSGATLTVDGRHYFNSLLLTNGAVLTHSPCTASETHKLDLVVSNEVVVSTNSRIDVSGRGYLPGRTTSNTINGASTQCAGGSYGGRAGDGGRYGSCRGQANAVYGDYANPDEWGSGSGLSGGGAAGGGLARIRAGRLQLEGQLVARGESRGVGGGAGGGIRVEVATSLTGGGSIDASGGSVAGWDWGGGGGGRVAVYAADFSAFDLANIRAWGGTNDCCLGSTPGGAGTLYLRDTDEPDGTLIIDAGSGGSGLTPLGLPGTNYFPIMDAVLIRSSRTRVVSEHPELIIDFQNRVVITNSAYLQVNGDLHLAAATALTLGAGGRLDVFGALNSDLTEPVLPGGFLQVNGPFTSSVPVTVNSAILSGDIVAAPQLVLTNGAVLTCPDPTTNFVHKLEVEVAGTIIVSTNSRIDVSGKGYVAGYATGNTIHCANSSCGCGGGSYGGLGGRGNFGFGQCGGAAPPVYGDYADPEDWGSGGAPIGGRGTGGGLVRIHTQRMRLDGLLLANGLNGGYAFGAGAGGGILLAVTGALEGSGRVEVNGGSGESIAPGGGGGRVAVYASDFSAFNTMAIVAYGGTNPPGSGATPGGAGTVHLVRGFLHTHARSYLPQGRFGGLVGYGLDSVSIYFNKPINTNSFDPTDFLIDGQMGRVLPIRMVEISNRTYRIDFPLLSENGRYHFTLLPSLLDVEGFPLDQNANGIPGEPEDAYSFMLIVDTVAPRVTQHAPAGDIAGTISSVDVWFSEKMDRAEFTAADIRIVRPDTQSVAVASIQEVGLNRWRIGFAPQTLVGAYHVRIGTNVTDLAGNTLTPALSQPVGEGVAYDAAFNIVQVDLELGNVALSTNVLVAGDPLTVSWTGRNNSGAPLLGDWFDAVYLSADNRWDINDILLATNLHTGGLASNEVYAAQASVYVPGLLPGNYHILVRADIANAERETNEANNIVAFGPIPLTVRPLPTDGTTFNGTLTPGNRAHYFAIFVPGGESLRLNLTGSGGVTHLHVSQSIIPTRLNSDFSSTAGSPNQSIELTGLSGGATYYALVWGEQIGGANAYELRAETAAMFVTGISPSRLNGASSVMPDEPCFLGKPIGRVVPQVVTVTGVGFDQNTTVEFISGGLSFSPFITQFASSSTLALELNLRGWPAGNYDVRVTKEATQLTRQSAFTVIARGRAQLEARLVVPNAINPGFPVRQTMWIEYANTGDAPMVAPLFKVSADLSAYFTHLFATLGGRGLINVPLQAVAQVMATGSGATPGILQPGDRGRIPIYYLGLQRDNGAPNIVFSLSRATADDVSWWKVIPIPAGTASTRAASLTAASQEQLTEATANALIDVVQAASLGNDAPLCARGFSQRIDRSIPWNDLKNSLKPDTIPADVWELIWSNVVAATGPDWGHYVEMLAANMNYLAMVGQATNDPAALFNFEIAKAAGTLNPVRNLAGAVDASVPSPGFPLVFRRVYGQPIASRFRLGPIGRGWTHNWDISIQPSTNGNVIVHGPGGVDRFFTLTPGVGYQPSPGDFGQLLPVADGFRLTETDKTIWKFRSDGLLDYVEDSNSNRITCG